MTNYVNNNILKYLIICPNIFIINNTSIYKYNNLYNFKFI